MSFYRPAESELQRCTHLGRVEASVRLRPSPAAVARATTPGADSLRPRSVAVAGDSPGRLPGNARPIPHRSNAPRSQETHLRARPHGLVLGPRGRASATAAAAGLKPLRPGALGNPLGTSGLAAQI